MKTERRNLWMAALAALLVMSLALPSVSADGKGRMLKLEITEAGKAKPTVKINLPLSLVEMVMDVVEIDEDEVSVRSGVVDVGGQKIDFRKLMDELKSLPPTEFLSIEDEDATVKIWLD